MAWLTLKPAAKYAHMREGTMRQLVNSGRIPAFVKPGTSRRVICTDDIDHFIKANCDQYISPAQRLIRRASGEVS